MRRFGYVRDPLCLVACGLYTLNRLWLRQHVGGAFLNDHFNDVFLIPAALPPVLWLQRRLGLRTHDSMPSWAEIILHLSIWSVAAEVIAPLLFHRAVADVWDVAAYTAGAVVAGIWWHWRK